MLIRIQETRSLALENDKKNTWLAVEERVGNQMKSILADRSRNEATVEQHNYCISRICISCLSGLQYAVCTNCCSGLDMSRFYKGPATPHPPVYDLYGVVNHHGSLMGGHYTAYARCLNKYDTTEVLKGMFFHKF